ncbi:bifunctional DNA primase/polymerase [Streptomyces sp. NBC_01795]|uniref:bifunctional DNA primase/polymerase n=1 Tax=unclassified Streptomyces TaxID=2593676 RepID=UPI002DDAD6DE|nr:MULTISPECIES: bifunctional DNA primase/polymerase [unclassified Streptomyces]WSA93738.1 bifunctional DNA primase/polymerase [Streptomyces sp. NBC_01795]WSB78109.1 bifunctional DNA primase/polymerase [Streptomyces sp. NBC_01775]WSS13639.1 bifunctional DNA primase/polymerase [Streptomyces sp. NBC_01186]
MGSLALEHALAAASRGLAVLPLSRNKLPALRSPHHARGPASAAPSSPTTPHDPPSPYSGGLTEPPEKPCHGECGLLGHGVHDATSDPEGVRALFAAAPWATGYGIACGRPPLHLVGLDLDVKNGTDSLGALERLADAHDFTLPPTTTVLTPSGGRHLWLRGPRDTAVPNSVGRLAPGIDVRGSGGYLVGPGSVTVRGTYRLAPGSLSQPPAPIPPGLLALLLPPPPGRRVGEQYAASYDRLGDGGPGAALIHFVRGAPVGQRNARLFWAACRAYETGRGDTLAEPLAHAAMASGLPEREARTTIASACHRAARFPTS